MKRTKSFHKYFPHFKAIVIGAGVALAAASAIAAHGQDNPPNPFGNLDKVKQQVTSYEKSDPGGPIDLHSTDVDYVLGRLTTVLALTPDQQTTVHGILSDQSRRVTDTEKSQTLGRSGRDIRLDAIFRNTDYRFTKTLTSEQLLKEKYIQSQSIPDPDEHRVQMLFLYDGKFAALDLSMAAAKWGEALGLSSEQQLALLPILKDEDASLDALAADKALSPDDSRIRAQEAMVSAERKIDATLTPEQKTRLQNGIVLGDAPSSDNPRAMAK